MADWFQHALPVILAIALGYGIGSLKAAHTKLDKLQKQVEHLHSRLYEAGIFDRSR